MSIGRSGEVPDAWATARLGRYLDAPRRSACGSALPRPGGGDFLRYGPGSRRGVSPCAHRRRRLPDGAGTTTIECGPDEELKLVFIKTPYLPDDKVDSGSRHAHRDRSRHIQYGRRWWTRAAAFRGSVSRSTPSRRPDLVGQNRPSSGGVLRPPAARLSPPRRSRATLPPSASGQMHGNALRTPPVGPGQVDHLGRWPQRRFSGPPEPGAGRGTAGGTGREPGNSVHGRHPGLVGRAGFGRIVPASAAAQGLSPFAWAETPPVSPATPALPCCSMFGAARGRAS